MSILFVMARSIVCCPLDALFGSPDRVVVRTMDKFELIQTKEGTTYNGVPLFQTTPTEEQLRQASDQGFKTVWCDLKLLTSEQVNALIKTYL